MGLSSEKCSHMREKYDLEAYVDHTRRPNGQNIKSRLINILSVFMITTCLWYMISIRSAASCFFFRGWWQDQAPPESGHNYDVAAFQECSIKTFLDTGLPFLKNAQPIPVEEFLERRNRLAEALIAEGVDAFIVEPGYTFKYYANISQPDWEVWEPEERPMLMIVQPYHDSETGKITANTTFLSPAFEESRVRLLNMPFTERLDVVQWEEHWNPYSTLRGSDIWSSAIAPSVMVDEEMRDFIQRGLGENGFNVVGLTGKVEKVRQTKTNREIEILRAVNTGTVEAMKAMRECLTLGFTMDEVKDVLDNTLRAGGMEPFFDIVEFGVQAALPHGGGNGSKRLEEGDFVLIDVGAHLHGYSSDVCRTFFPPSMPKSQSEEDISALSPMLRESLHVWDVVMEAQDRSIAAMVPNASCASVDIAARTVIEDAGYGPYFTHRVGHSIGIKAHESPYLNKGNFDVTLRAGMVFTSEPGIYVWNVLGVRHEDVMLVKEGGVAECLSCGTGERASSPWDL